MRTCNPEALLSEASPAALLYPPCQLTASGRVQMPNIYFVYILASRSLTLYTGVTNGLLNRVSQHHQGLIPGFAATYRIFRLVYFEKFTDVRAAIARENK